MRQGDRGHPAGAGGPPAGRSRRGVAGAGDRRQAAGARSPRQPARIPFEHPDAQRRFRVMTNVEELERALEFPWEKWTVFLHPEQRHWVERDYAGPARVSGSAGTGKTIVALHRAAHLARTHPDARVLLTTFSETLASMPRRCDCACSATSRGLRSGSTFTRSMRSACGSTEARVGKVAHRDAQVIRELLEEAARRWWRPQVRRCISS